VRRIAIANLKGGVGKSTSTLFFAEHLALKGFRVLVLDLDPQSNVSIMLLSRQGLDGLQIARKTLFDFFMDSRHGRVMNALAYIEPYASDLIELRPAVGKGKIDILPSIPAMWFTSYDFDKFYFASGREPVGEHVQMISTLLHQVDLQYEYVLIDCPPGFGTLTRTGLALADHIISPTVADAVSQRSLADFVTFGLEHTLRLDVAKRHMVIVSRYRGTNNEKAMLDLLLRSYRVIEPAIPLRDAMLDATEHIKGRPRTYGQKYDASLRPHISALCDALIRAISQTSS
jgi:chromosome partitioning protein